MVNSAIFTIVFVCIIAIIVWATNRKMGNTEIASEGKTEIMQNQEEQSMPKALTEIKAREPNTNNFTNVTSEDGIQVPVPKGYVASTDAEERYVNGVTTDGVREHHGGFVIYEKNEGETDEEATEAIEDDIDTAKVERNQWVWVPVNNPKDMYHISKLGLYANKYIFNENGYSIDTSIDNEPIAIVSSMNDQLTYFEGFSRLKIQEEIKEEFYNMINSVQTYGGFYIGRYETGNLSQTKPCIQKNNSDIKKQCWAIVYKRCKNLKGTRNNVVTGVIWGIQWDQTLKWIIDSQEKTPYQISVDSTSWGEYAKNVYLDQVEAYPSGRFQANHIYDLAR